MRRIALCVLLSFLGCDSGPIDIEERPIVEDKAPFGMFDDNGEQVSQNVRLSGVIEDDQVLMFLNCPLGRKPQSRRFMGVGGGTCTWYPSRST